MIAAAALDVFEVEPFSLETHKKLLQYRERLILGSHNGSNTQQAVSKVSKDVLSDLGFFLNEAIGLKILLKSFFIF